MSKKSAPAAPDPVQTINAQTASNKDTASYNQTLNMIGSSGPNGSVNYVADPSQPSGYRQVTTLSPGQQQLYDQSTATQIGALGIANDQLGRVAGALGQSVTPTQLAYGTAAGGNGIQGSVGSGSPLATSFDRGQPVQGSYATQGAQTSYGSGGPITQSYGVQQAQSSYDPGGAIQTSFSPGGSIQAGVAPTSQGVQYGYASGGPVQYGYGSGGQIQRQVGDQNINQSVQNASNAAYQQATSRLDPQYAQSQEALQSQLTAQGLNSNDAAWQTAMQNFGQQKNDAYNQANYSAIAAGNAEQQALYQQQLSSGQFANQAQQQANTQNANQAQFYNSAQGQANSQNAAQAAFHNAAQGQEYGQNLSSMQATNAAQAQQFGQNQAEAQFGNAAQLQQNQENAAASAFANSAAAQNTAANAGLAAFQNSAQQQGNQQNLQAGQFANAGAAQNTANAAGLAAFGNSAAGQQFAQNQGAAAFGNQASDDAYARALQAAQFGNQAQAQTYAQQQGDAALNNSAQQQAFQQNTYNQQLPINELSALLSLGQVQSPTGINYTPSQAQSTNVAGITQSAYQDQLSAWQTQQAQTNAILGGLAGLGGAAIGKWSDARLKEDIAPVGRLDSGLTVYRYRYKGSPQVEIGVLAQEAMHTHPHAVVRDPSGFLAVDYGALS